MDVIDLRALEEAVTVFYRSCSTEQAKAHEWLTKVQNSPQAWSFAWDLMAPDKVSPVHGFHLVCKRNLETVERGLRIFCNYTKNTPFLVKPSEIQFFGATTLHSKLMKYWHEVPKENHEELKQKLLESIIAFGSGPKIVLNRLCISVVFVLFVAV